MKEISINQNSSTERVKFGPVGRDIILNEKIEDETARAIAKETQLEEAIATAGAVKDVKCDGTSIVVSKVADIGPSIDAKVLVETTRATAAETTLTTNLAAEVTRAQGAETTLTNNLATEATARQNADTAEATARAAQDLVLNTRIDNIENRGRYLSTWNATTGKPGSYPEVPVGAEYPYTYSFKPGDYYIINNVPATGTKYKPTGSSITKQDAEAEWTIGRAEETESVSNNGSYTFDSTNWILISSGTVAAWGSIGGNITDQTDLADALSNKVDLSSAQTITGVKTFSNGLKTSSNASISSDTAGSSFKWNDVSYLNVRYDGIYPVSYYSDMSVGGFNNKWKDVYLNGAVKFPTSSTTDYLELKGESNGNVSINRKFNTVDYPVVTFSGNNATFVYGLTVVDVPLTRSSDFNSLHIGGDKNLSLNGNIYPQFSNGKSIGTSTYKWGDLYLSGTAHIGGASLSESGNILSLDKWFQVAGNIQPDATGTRLLGSASKAWNTVYTTTIQNNGAGLLIGNADGNTNFVRGSLNPYWNGVSNLGSASEHWQDLYLSGEIDIAKSTDSYVKKIIDDDSELIFRLVGTNTYTPFEIFPTYLNCANLYPNTDGENSLGYSERKWKDLYLSGIAHIGTASYITTDTLDSLRFVSDSGIIWSNSSIVTDNGNGKLGTSDNQWSSLYVKDINMTGSLTDGDGSQGTAGQVLTSNGPDAPATWQDASGGGGGEYTIINLSDLPIQSGTNRKLNFNDYPSGSYILRYDGTSTSEVVSTVYIHVNNSGTFKSTINLYGSIDSYNLAYFRIFEGRWPGLRSFDFTGYTAQSWKRYAGQASSNTSTSSGKWLAVGDSWEIGRFIKSFNGASYGQPGNDWSSYYFDLYAPKTSGTSGQFLKSNGANNAPTWADAPAPSNMVNTDTIQTITGGKTFDSGGITIGRDSEVSKINFTGNASWGSSGFGINGQDSANRPYFELAGHFRPTSTGSQDLGGTSYQWKNIYTRGMEIYGGNTTTYPNSPALTFVYKKSGGTYNNSLTLDSIGSDGLASFRLDGRFSPGKDATYNMGYSDLRWKDIYASRNISDGTNSTTVANIATKSTESAQQVTGQLKICVVTALPENPDSNTLYFILGS